MKAINFSLELHTYSYDVLDMALKISGFEVVNFGLDGKFTIRMKLFARFFFFF